MYYVYLLQSINAPNKKYTGYTTNIETRLSVHNSGGSIATKADCPWKLVAYMVFFHEDHAVDFEKYLKSGSGREFAHRRLWPSKI
jgi:putative endonuclease